MAGVYRPRHPERTVLYRVLFHHFERFLAEYETRFEREYGYFRPIVKEVVEKYLDCGNPRCGFARIRCPDCRAEHLLTFSCKTRGYAVHSIFGDSAHPVMPSGLRSGASGCGRRSFWMSLTVRSSSPSPRCCGATGDGLSGVYRPGDLPHPGQGPSVVSQ